MKKLEENETEKLSAYEFDTSKYILLNMRVRRSRKTGRLVQKQKQSA